MAKKIFCVMPEYSVLEKLLMSAKSNWVEVTIAGFKVLLHSTPYKFLMIRVNEVLIADNKDWCVAFEALDLTIKYSKK